MTVQPDRVRPGSTITVSSTGATCELDLGPRAKYVFTLAGTTGPGMTLGMRSVSRNGRFTAHLKVPNKFPAGVALLSADTPSHRFCPPTADCSGYSTKLQVLRRGHGPQTEPSLAGRHGCVVATELSSARSGRIIAGPFAENAGQWRREGGTKFWVGSKRQQRGEVSATIRATKSAQDGKRIVERRGPDQRASVPDMPVFFPGLLRLPSHGRWIIEVNIGRDRGCFVVKV